MVRMSDLSRLIGTRQLSVIALVVLTSLSGCVTTESHDGYPVHRVTVDTAYDETYTPLEHREHGPPSDAPARNATVGVAFYDGRKGGYQGGGPGYDPAFCTDRSNLEDGVIRTVNRTYCVPLDAEGRGTFELAADTPYQLTFDHPRSDLGQVDGCDRRTTTGGQDLPTRTLNGSGHVTVPYGIYCDG